MALPGKCSDKEEDIDENGDRRYNSNGDNITCGLRINQDQQV